MVAFAEALLEFLGLQRQVLQPAVGTADAHDHVALELLDAFDQDRLSEVAGQNDTPTDGPFGE